MLKTIGLIFVKAASDPAEYLLEGGGFGIVLNQPCVIENVTLVSNCIPSKD